MAVLTSLDGLTDPDSLSLSLFAFCVILYWPHRPAVSPWRSQACQSNKFHGVETNWIDFGMRLEHRARVSIVLNSSAIYNNKDMPVVGIGWGSACLWLCVFGLRFCHLIVHGRLHTGSRRLAFPAVFPLIIVVGLVRFAPFYYIYSCPKTLSFPGLKNIKSCLHSLVLSMPQTSLSFGSLCYSKRFENGGFL